MKRNYTATRSYLLQPENLQKTIHAINDTRSETWRNGWSTTQLEKKYKKTSGDLKRIKDEIREKIDRISDDKLRVILVKRYLEFKSGMEIQRVTGWSEKFIKSLHERALMNMEIILLEDGILTFVNPEADMMADYEDGLKRGRHEGYQKGYGEGYDNGYEEGYERCEQGLPFDKSEDEDLEEDSDDCDEDDDEYGDEDCLKEDD